MAPKDNWIEEWIEKSKFTERYKSILDVKDRKGMADYPKGAKNLLAMMDQVEFDRNKEYEDLSRNQLDARTNLRKVVERFVREYVENQIGYQKECSFTLASAVDNRNYELTREFLKSIGEETSATQVLCGEANWQGQREGIVEGRKTGKEEGYKEGHSDGKANGLFKGFFIGALVLGGIWIASNFLGNKKDVTEKTAPKTEQVQKISALTP